MSLAASRRLGESCAKLSPLAPQPQVDFKKQTTNIVFGSVPIASLDLVLWLPQSVDAEMEASGQYLQEQHRYSKYRLYQAKSKIILPPE